MFIDKEHSWFLDHLSKIFISTSMSEIIKASDENASAKVALFSQSGYGVFWRVAIREPILKNIKYVI